MIFFVHIDIVTSYEEEIIITSVENVKVVQIYFSISISTNV